MDIVDRLRKRAAAWLSVGWGNNDIFDEAADEIERLREAAKDRPKDRPNEAADEIERLREALREIDKGINQWLHDGSYIKRALLKISSAALKEGE